MEGCQVERGFNRGHFSPLEVALVVFVNSITISFSPSLRARI
jgi:hypothetical protein